MKLYYADTYAQSYGIRVAFVLAKDKKQAVEIMNSEVGYYGSKVTEKDLTECECNKACFVTVAEYIE